MAQQSRLDIRLRIDFGTRRSLGPGKVALLEHIESAGSLSQAARELGMSYRRAWQLLDDLNNSFGTPAATASVGGAGGGGARLTSFGKEIVAAYREVENAALEQVRARFGEIAREPEPARSIKSRLRRFLSRSAPKRATAGAAASGRAAKRS